MMDKLLPCPFCGGEAIVVKTERCGRYVGCWDCGGRTEEFETDYAGSAHDKAIAAWNRRAKPENEPLTRCENCTHWDKSISFMMSAHACSYWSPSKRSPRYTEGFEFCSFASAKPERSEGE